MTPEPAPPRVYLDEDVDVLLAPLLAAHGIDWPDGWGGGDVLKRKKAEAGNKHHVGAPMPGLVARVLVAPGDQVVAGEKLFTLEAMKMETTIQAEAAGEVAEVLVQPGAQVEAGDLLLRFEG